MFLRHLFLVAWHLLLQRSLLRETLLVNKRFLVCEAGIILDHYAFYVQHRFEATIVQPIFSLNNYWWGLTWKNVSSQLTHCGKYFGSHA